MSMPMPEPLPDEPKKNRTPMIIAIVLAVLCCCCLIGVLAGVWLWQNGDSLVGTSALLNALSAL